MSRSRRPRIRMCAACLSVLCSSVISSAVLANQGGFERTYSDRDSTASAVIQTSDGGYVVAGDTDLVGHPDFYLLRTDAAGDVVWETDFGHRGDGDDAAHDVVELADGRLVVVGVSDRGDLGPISSGVYVVTTDASGELLWEGTFGGFGGNEVIVDRNGDLVVVGGNTSDGSRILTGDTDWDIYLVKLDTLGNPIWTKNLDASTLDHGSSIQPAADGGYLVLGSMQPARGDEDILLIKTDADGTREWQKTFGTAERRETGRSLLVTQDGGLIIAADSGIDATLVWDVHLIRTGATGDARWSETFGTPAKEFVMSVVQTADGGFALAGWGTRDGSSNALLTKVDADGNSMWETDFGGDDDDRASSLRQTADGGFVLAGWSRSFTAPDSYNRQVYLVKTGPEGRLTGTSFRRGDCNSDDRVEISDAVFSLGSLFLGDGNPGCDDACDSNDDGAVDIADAINTLGVLFLGEGVIPLPGTTECGVDPTDDELSCTTFGPCP